MFIKSECLYISIDLLLFRFRCIFDFGGVLLFWQWWGSSLKSILYDNMYFAFFCSKFYFCFAFLHTNTYSNLYWKKVNIFRWCVNLSNLRINTCMRMDIYCIYIYIYGTMKIKKIYSPHSMDLVFIKNHNGFLDLSTWIA